jgi:hypothetical protein
MLQHHLDEAERILVVTPQGPLATSDFAALRAEVDPFIEHAGGLLGLLIEAEAFPGWDGFAALTAPSTAYMYDWNLLPIGQHLALKFLESYEKFPPLQSPPSFNLEEAMAKIRAQKQKVRTAGHPSE